MRQGQITVYPDEILRRAIQDAAKDDHSRPLAHVCEMALRAWVVLYREDKYNALKLADSFDKPATPRRVA